MSVFEEWVQDVIPEKSSNDGRFEYTPIGGTVIIDVKKTEEPVLNFLIDRNSGKTLEVTGNEDVAELNAMYSGAKAADVEDVKKLIEKLVAARAEMEVWKGRALTAEGKIAAAISALQIPKNKQCNL